jgi:hypothetical protein
VNVSRIIIALLGLICVSGVLSPQYVHAQNIEMTYTGELVDGDSRPISGVFHLRFVLYESSDGETPAWVDERYVAVYDGMYNVALGRYAPLPDSFDERDMTLAVELGAFGEIARFPLKIESTPPEPTRDEIIANLDITYADLAERAIHAEEAREAGDCLTLGGRRLEELDRFDEILSQIVELRDEVSRATVPRVGARTTTLERVGGAGGIAYVRTCPSNHVVVGMRGGAGNFIDSIELICAPLE